MIEPLIPHDGPDPAPHMFADAMYDAIIQVYRMRPPDQLPRYKTGIYRGNHNTWEVKWYDETGRRRSKTFTERGKAVKFHEERQ